MVKFDDTKEVIRSRKSKSDKQHNDQVWRYQRGNQKRKSKTDKQHNGQVWRYQRGNQKS